MDLMQMLMALSGGLSPEGQNPNPSMVTPPALQVAATAQPAAQSSGLAAQLAALDPHEQRRVQVESAGNPNAVSPKGAAGLMQIMPATARDPGYGVKPLQGWDGKDPRTASTEEQLRFGTEYAKAMKDKFGNQYHADAAYNMGPGALQEHLAGLRGMPAETKAYAGKLNGGVEAPTSSPSPNTAMRVGQPSLWDKIMGTSGSSPMTTESVGASKIPEKKRDLSALAPLMQMIANKPQKTPTSPGPAPVFQGRAGAINPSLPLLAELPLPGVNLRQRLAGR